MVAIPDKSLQVTWDKFPDGNLLLNLSVIRVLAKSIKGAELRKAFGVCKKVQLRKKQTTSATDWRS